MQPPFARLEPSRATRALAITLGLAGWVLVVAAAPTAFAQPPPQAVPGHYPGPAVATPPAAAVPAATPASAGVTPSGTCEPTCSPGFYCRAGACQSLCNPACGPGEYCTEQRMCALASAVPPAFPYQPPPGLAAPYGGPIVVTPAEAQFRRDEEKRQRLQLRLLPRLGVGGGLGISLVDQPRGTRDDEIVTIAGVNAVVTARRHFVPFFGVELKAAILFGEASVNDSNRSGGDNYDETEAIDLSFQASPIFNPFWRFYLGPVLAVHHRWFREKVLSGRLDSYALHPGWHTAIGGQLGLMLLPKEQLDLDLQITGDERGQVDVMFTTSFHFLLGS